ncbi:6-phosphogluconolactonase [Pseudomarimonas salicorniae]|uniref:6-phosphogluconolactonase n=1 Tax=Pseudomarimonas salicorniae TaxID=2933270 RepID=A0ABT0GLQ3_9GAMM|nr:6-phosphogluconolactonase [Lysobacter sp. CAU 1642]MCK7595473.1 6-phosphogluconolactonase [Lysobacter sp. CAU 1642]
MESRGRVRGVLVECPDAGAFAAALASRLGELIDRALTERGRAVLALAGGRTPFAAYRLLAAQARDWSRVSLLATDERWVDADHAHRNEAEMRRAFEAASGVHFVPLVPAKADGAPNAEFAEARLVDLDAPFDAVVLGMGGDAHTASLFPGSPGLDSAIDPSSAGSAFVVTPQPLPPEAPHARITLGLARLKRSHARILGITGDGKRKVWQSVLDAEPSADRPIGLFLHDAAAPVAVYWSP